MNYFIYYLPYIFELISVIDFGLTWLGNKLYTFSQNNPSFSFISDWILNNSLVGDVWLIITALNVICCGLSFFLSSHYDEASFTLSKWIGLISILLCLILLFTV